MAAPPAKDEPDEIGRQALRNTVREDQDVKSQVTVLAPFEKWTIYG
jgi:hypothetical protein